MTYPYREVTIHGGGLLLVGILFRFRFCRSEAVRQFAMLPVMSHASAALAVTRAVLWASTVDLWIMWASHKIRDEIEIRMNNSNTTERILLSAKLSNNLRE